jgi:hypothetical protein
MAERITKMWFRRNHLWLLFSEEINRGASFAFFCFGGLLSSRAPLRFPAVVIFN